jgi:integrase/recombinase XerD
MCRDGVIPANPAADLDLPRKQVRQLPKALDQSEIARLLAIPNIADPFGLRDRAMLELFYATGIRRTEMSNLDVGDYDPHSQTLMVRQGKGGKSRMLPVGARAAAWMDRFLSEARPQFAHLPGETALFLSGYGTRITPGYLGNWIKKLMRQCEIDKPGSCHLFRHSCATDMHRGGADIRYVQEMLGHARMETTQIYTHVHIEKLREIHARCHPHGSQPDALETPDAAEPEKTASQPPTPEVVPETMNPVATAPKPTASAGGCAAASDACADPPAKAITEPNPDIPPDDEAGGTQTHPPIKPRPNGPDPASCTSSADEKTKENLGFRPCVEFYGYRYYDPVTGRWPSRDPIGERGGVNLYAMLQNDGINRLDILGLSGLMFYLRPSPLLRIQPGQSIRYSPAEFAPSPMPTPSIRPYPAPITISPNTNPSVHPAPYPAAPESKLDPELGYDPKAVEDWENEPATEEARIERRTKSSKCKELHDAYKVPRTSWRRVNNCPDLFKAYKEAAKERANRQRYNDLDCDSIPWNPGLPKRDHITPIENLDNELINIINKLKKEGCYEHRNKCWWQFWQDGVFEPEDPTIDPYTA